MYNKKPAKPAAHAVNYPRINDWRFMLRLRYWRHFQALIFMKYDLNLSPAQERLFGFFAATNVIMLVLLVKYLPETCGMTLEQIEKKFRF